MPGLLYIYAGSNHAGENNAAYFVFGDRFNRNSEAAGVLVGDGSRRLDRRVAYEPRQLCVVYVWIAQWGVETDDSTDGHSGRTLVVNANGGSVANVGAISSATRETITSDGISGRQQSVVFRCSDVQSLTWFNATGHYSSPNALKFASG